MLQSSYGAQCFKCCKPHCPTGIQLRVLSDIFVNALQLPKHIAFSILVIGHLCTSFQHVITEGILPKGITSSY